MPLIIRSLVVLKARVVEVTALQLLKVTKGEKFAASFGKIVHDCLFINEII